MYEFPIRRNVRQSCYKYGVNISGKRCCGGFFAEDVVLKAPSKSCLRILLNKVHERGIRNEMIFGINKYATMVIKPLF